MEEIQMQNAYTVAEYQIGDTRVCCDIDNGFFYPEKFSLSPHMHSSFELHIPIDGTYEIEMSASGKRYAALPGTVLVMPKNAYHNCIVAQEETVRKYTMRLRFARSGQETDCAEPIYDLLFEFLSKLSSEPLTLSFPQAKEILSAVREEYMGSGIGWEALARAEMQGFLVLLLRTLLCIGESDPGKSVLSAGKRDWSYTREQDISAFLANHYAMPNLTEEVLADYLHLSRRQVSRLISSYYQMTFRQKLTEVRLLNGCRLLARTETSVEDIAYAVGFQSPSAFFVSFRRKFGKTPREYRVEMKK